MASLIKDSASSWTGRSGPGSGRDPVLVVSVSVGCVVVVVLAVVFVTISVNRKVAFRTVSTLDCRINDIIIEENEGATPAAHVKLIAERYGVDGRPSVSAITGTVSRGCNPGRGFILLRLCLDLLQSHIAAGVRAIPRVGNTLFGIVPACATVVVAGRIADVVLETVVGTVPVSGGT